MVKQYKEKIVVAAFVRSLYLRQAKTKRALPSPCLLCLSVKPSAARVTLSHAPASQMDERFVLQSREPKLMALPWLIDS